MDARFSNLVDAKSLLDIDVRTVIKIDISLLVHLINPVYLVIFINQIIYDFCMTGDRDGFRLVVETV